MNKVKNHFRDNSAFYKMMVGIAIPIALQNLIVFSVTMMDTLMLGSVGSAQLSASAQANQPSFILQMLIFGLSGGGTVLTSQYWGKGDKEKVKTVMGIVMKICVGISFIFMLTCLLIPQEIMHIYLKHSTTEEIYIVNEAVSYLRIVAFSYVFWAVSLTFSFMLRSVELVKVSVIASIIAFFVNVIMNWIFIFGHFGAPRLGIRGAAVGTLCARIVEFLLIITFIFVKDKKLEFRIKYIFKRDKQLFRDFLKYSLPVATNELAWGIAISVQAAILGNLSTTILASNSIASVVQQLAMIVAMGIANAACVAVGKRIGEGSIDVAYNDGKIIMNWSILLGFAAMVFVFFMRGPILSLYTQIDDATRDMAMKQMVVTSVLVFFQTINVASIVGVLRGAGDTKFSMILEMATLWCIALPAGLLCGFVFKAPILMTYAFLKIDELLKSLVAFPRTRRKNVFRNITR